MGRVCVSFCRCCVFVSVVIIIIITYFSIALMSQQSI